MDRKQVPERTAKKRPTIINHQGKNPPSRHKQPLRQAGKTDQLPDAHPEKKGFRYDWPAYLIIALLAVAVYGNTIPNDYALDDAAVITQNMYTQQGIAGLYDIFATEFFTGFFKSKTNWIAGGRYRPLSVATFALEYEFFGANPHVSHFLNIIFFAISCILLYRVLDRMFRDYDASRWYFSLPFVAAVLYAVHPIHTEVVSNIKGRDEIFVLIASLSTLLYTMSYIDYGKKRYIAYIPIAFFLALISKENAVPFIVLIPMTVYFFIKRPFRQVAVPVVAMLAAGLVYAVIRLGVLGNPTGDIPNELMNNSFLHATNGEKYATIVYTLGLYIKLLFFPHPLTFDYYPYHIPLMTWSNGAVLLSLVGHIGLAAYAILGLRKKRVIAFGILFYAISISIVSNILFPIGTFASERFLFVPSIGFCIIIAYLVAVKVPQWIRSATLSMIVAGIFLASSTMALGAQTIIRNTQWKDNFTLFTHDATVSANGALSNCAAGGVLIDEALKPENKARRNAMLLQAIKYLDRAIEIHPTYADALVNLSNAWWEYDHDLDRVAGIYSRMLKVNPNFNRVWMNMEEILNNPLNVDDKIRFIEKLRQFNPERFEANYRLGVLFGKEKNDLVKATFYLEKAVKERPDSKEGNKDMGVAYSRQGRFDEALKYLHIASQLDPNDTQTLVNIGAIYRFIGQGEKAREYFDRALKIDPKIVIPPGK